MGLVSKELSQAHRLSRYLPLPGQVTKDPDAGSDIGNSIMSIAVLLAEEVFHTF
jgi:hypothetical protein